MRHLYNLPVKSHFLLLLLAGFAGLLALPACRSARTIQTAISKKDTVVATVIIHPTVDSSAIINGILDKIKHATLSYNSFAAKVKVDFTDKSGQEQGATAFVRLQKDSLIWVSLTGTLGVEGFRAIISPDSVLVMDKLKKTISRRSIASLQDLTGLPLDFTALQDIIVGNPVYFSNNIVSFENNGNTITALSIGNFFKHLMSIDTLANVITQSKIDDVDSSRNRTCFISFSDYLPAQGGNFSSRREIIVTEKTSLNIKLEYKQFSFDEPVVFPFTIPKSYKEK